VERVDRGVLRTSFVIGCLIDSSSDYDSSAVNEIASTDMLETQTELVFVSLSNVETAKSGDRRQITHTQAIDVEYLDGELRLGQVDAKVVLQRWLVQSPTK
jgi:uncharacterized membrane protein